MKKILGTIILSMITAAIVKALGGSGKQKPVTKRRKHTSPREEAYIKLEKKSGGKKRRLV